MISKQVTIWFFFNLKTISGLCVEWVGCAEMGGPEGVWRVATLCGARGGQLHAKGGEHRLYSHRLHPDPGWSHEPIAGQVPGGWRHTGSPEQWGPSGLHHCECFCKTGHGAVLNNHKKCNSITSALIHYYCSCNIIFYIVCISFIILTSL